MPFVGHGIGYTKRSTPSNPFRYLTPRGCKWLVRVPRDGGRVYLGYFDLDRAIREREAFERSHPRRKRFVRRCSVGNTSRGKT